MKNKIYTYIEKTIKNSECKLSWGRGSALVKVSGGQVQGHNTGLLAHTKPQVFGLDAPNCPHRHIPGKSLALGPPGFWVPGVPRVEHKPLLTEQTITLLGSNLENKTRHTFLLTWTKTQQCSRSHVTDDWLPPRWSPLPPPPSPGPPTRVQPPVAVTKFDPRNTTLPPLRQTNPTSWPALVFVTPYWLLKRPVVVPARGNC